MIKDVEILVLVDDTTKIEALLQGYSYVTIVADYEHLKEKLLDFDYTHSRVVLIDVKYLTSKKKIEKDLLYKAASFVAYGKNISVVTAKKLYGLDFKGIIDEALDEGKTVLSHVVRRSNLFAANYINNFVRGIIEYRTLNEDIKEIVYVLNMLICKYDISNRDASNIRLVLLSLVVAFKDEKILKVATTLKIIFKSEEIDRLYRNYHMPESFHEKIIVLLLQIYNRKHPSRYVDAINMSYVEPSLIEEVEEIYRHKMLNIASFQDIGFFTEQFNLFSSENIDVFFETVHRFLMDSLMRTYYFSASVIQNDESIQVYLEYVVDIETIMHDEKEKYISDDNHISLEFINKHRVCIACTKSGHKKVQADKVIDISKIEMQHYRDDEKISATQFLEEFVLDQALLDELQENEEEMQNIFYKEKSLTQELLMQASIIMSRYANILGQTVEFMDLSSSLLALSVVLGNVDVEQLESSKKETIYFYLQGLIDDLGKWKKYIFIEPNTPDIHYMDASLLENCATIESFIVSDNAQDVSVEDDDDDLEFF